MYPRNGRWDLGISVVIFFIMTPVPFTRTLCVLAACTFVRRFTRVDKHFTGDHTASLYQSLVSPLSATDFMQGETLKVRNEDIQALFLQASGPSQKVWEALCWGMGTGLVPGTGCGGLGQEAGAGCLSPLCGTRAGGPSSLLWPSEFLVLIGWAM